MSDQKSGAGVASYAEAGVDVAGLEGGLGRLVRRLEETTSFPRIGSPALPNGFFANVLDLGTGQGLAIGTDGVGTKILVAHALRKYDTVGIDLIAMNVNDVVCVGAEPIAMVDYIAVPSTDAEMLDQLAIGLVEGARQSRISIPGGEIAQVKELLRAHPPDDRESFDLVGTAVGVVSLDRLVVGRDMVPGDVLIGLPSAGIHSNGLTLARKVLAKGNGPEDYAERPSELGGASIGEELLRPTRIYVREAMALLDAPDVDVRAMVHITGDGFLNLLRVDCEGIGFEIDALPPSPPLFDLIADRGGISVPEQFLAFNMGTGFCIVVPEDQADRALTLLGEVSPGAQVMGRAVSDPQERVLVRPAGLVGVGKEFIPER